MAELTEVEEEVFDTSDTVEPDSQQKAKVGRKQLTDSDYSIVYLAWNKNRFRTEYDPETGEPKQVPVDNKEKKMFSLKVNNSELLNQGYDFVLKYNEKLEKMRKDNRVTLIKVLPVGEAQDKGLDKQVLTSDEYMDKIRRGEEEV